ncbi:MAG TPA: tRNA (adenosine(37)-N6)-dimethylallyltransferase MiaA [Candidatus Merdicola faecigallinarum]|uniref:tRNA dimethylallyltransferase n=1 Tax=Candidatus Merdicola faecigallinarum TaxID=2840862 RepID=A0A9D1S9N2_9FIRM|nr:tRNA (adenosine(37)-N6)-dimethylallyltransferase MiaA [Candidatus Merdicola faecigallinarum]
MKSQKPIVIVIGGPTASGKTGLSIALAKEINGQIISADSMQIYKEMNIGTAKVTKEEMKGIKHYLIDRVYPNERYSVAQFKEDAEKAIRTILEEGKVPIVVGGTGLYINSLIYNIHYEDTKIDEEYRKFLEKRVEEEGLETLYQEAKAIDEEATRKISERDQKRILRILELYHQTGKTKTQLEIESRKEEPKYDYRVFGLHWEREVLYDRINQRVNQMLKQGLIQEVETIWKKYKEFPTAMQGLGYKEVVQYLKEEVSYEEMEENIKRESRRYAKRQMTWFRAIPSIKWLEGEEKIQNNIHIILEGLE